MSTVLLTSTVIAGISSTPSSGLSTFFLPQIAGQCQSRRILEQTEEEAANRGRGSKQRKKEQTEEEGRTEEEQQTEEESKQRKRTKQMKKEQQMKKEKKEKVKRSKPKKKEKLTAPSEDTTEETNIETEDCPSGQHFDTSEGKCLVDSQGPEQNKDQVLRKNQVIIQMILAKSQRIYN